MDRQRVRLARNGPCSTNSLQGPPPGQSASIASNGSRIASASTVAAINTTVTASSATTTRYSDIDKIWHEWRIATPHGPVDVYDWGRHMTPDPDDDPALHHALHHDVPVRVDVLGRSLAAGGLAGLAPATCRGHEPQLKQLPIWDVAPA